MKTLISWMGTKADFDFDQTTNTTSVNNEGPHKRLYTYYLQDLGFKKHILLINDPEDGQMVEKQKQLKQSLRSELRRFEKEERPDIVIDSIKVNNPFSLHEVHSKLKTYLENHQQEQFTAFIQPGTRDAYVAWFLLREQFKGRLDLLQLRDPKYSADTKRGDLQKEVELIPKTIPELFDLREPQSETTYVDFQPEATEKALQIANQAIDDLTVLVLGEHGSGKDSIARKIHDNTKTRCKRPYRVVNCAGYTDELLRSELFGHKKGSFTGADSDKKGLFEEAKGGTVFLDEIGDISHFMQVSLLRVLENQEITRVGDTKPTKIDVRIVAATNKDLPEACERGDFRWDLFYRLAGIEIETIAFRNFPNERKVQAINHFIDSLFLQFKGFGNNQRIKKIRLSKDTRRVLEAHEFPGNIRELQNLIKALYIHGQADIQPKHLPKRILAKTASRDESLKAAELRHIEKVFNKYRGDRKQTQEALRINSRDTLLKKLKELYPEKIPAKNDPYFL